MKYNVTSSALALIMAGCVHLAHVEPGTRTELERGLTTVKIESSCGGDIDGYEGNATGVVISERHILTAAHAVACSDFPDVHATVGGRRLRVVVTREDHDQDIARLEIASADRFHLDIAPPNLVNAASGEFVCLYKSTNIACGWANWDGTIIQNMLTHPGDSGAPVYTSRGNLAGLVVGGNGKDTKITLVDDSWLSGT